MKTPIQILDSTELDLLVASLRVVIGIHEKLNPCVPDDCADQLPVILGHLYQRNQATLRNILSQLDCFGDRAYCPDKESEEERNGNL